MAAVHDPVKASDRARVEMMAQVLLQDSGIHEIDTIDGQSAWVPGGILVVDKPEGMTSSRAVKKVMKWLRLEKAGHCGTLDPFATGVLVICLNQATRISDLLSLQNKRYLATLRLGIETNTLDRTGEIVREHEGEPVAPEAFSESLEAFRGTLMQQVPRFSAVHVEGRRLYEYARKGIEVVAPVREVCIHKLELTAFDWPFATLDVACSKGTYVRQLAADMGHHLGCGAHLSGLRRLESGPFRIGQAIALEALSQLKDMQQLHRSTVPMAEALGHLRQVIVEDERLLKLLMDGSLDAAWEAKAREGCARGSGPVRILDGGRALRALWWPDLQADQGRRLRVFKN